MNTVYMVILVVGVGLVFNIMDQYMTHLGRHTWLHGRFGMFPPVSRISGSIDTLTIDYLRSNGCVG